jgi:hypothetical protein
VVADHPADREAEHPRWIRIPEVYFPGEGKLGQVIHLLDIIWTYSCFFESLPVEVGVVINIAYDGLEPVLLQRSKLLRGHAFNAWIPIT